MFSLGLPAIGLSLVFSVLLCVHVVRTGRELFWLWIILLIPLGNIVYFVAIVLPALFGGTAARRVGQAARETLDPGRDYRDAKAAYDLTPTVHNQMRLASAAAELGRHEEAEALYREALQGVHADDPALLLGRARALIELGRPAEALPLLEMLRLDGKQAETPQAQLALARTLEALGRIDEAGAAYRSAVARFPGLEAVARQAAFLARSGRRQEAEEALADIDKRLSRTNPRFRKEGRAWRDLAAQAIAQA